jgi:hypothetical protein
MQFLQPMTIPGGYEFVAATTSQPTLQQAAFKQRAEAYRLANPYTPAPRYGPNDWTWASAGGSAPPQPVGGSFQGAAPAQASAVPVTGLPRTTRTNRAREDDIIQDEIARRREQYSDAARVSPIELFGGNLGLDE